MSTNAQKSSKTLKAIAKYNKLGLTRDILVDLYCNKGYNYLEIANQFDISQDIARKLVLVYHDIHRSPEQEKLAKERLSKKLQASHNEESLAKKRQTCLDKYGAESWAASDIGKQRNQKTHNSEEYKEKVKQSNLKKYGVEHFFQSYDFDREQALQKKRQTSLEKYGSEYWNQNPELVKQFKDSYQNSVNVRNETNLERYGTINPNSLDEVKAKVRETNLSRYGVENVAQLNSSKEKYKQTCLEKYGCENAFQNEEVRRKHKETCEAVYGVVNPAQIHLSEYSPEFQNFISSPEQAIKFLENHSLTRYELGQYFKLPLSLLENWIVKYDLSSYIKSEKSHYENELKEIFSPLGFTVVNNRSLLGNGEEIDLFNPDKNIGIEFNGNYWHSDLHKTKNYHFNKSKLAQNKGIRLIHIYEYEWNDPIKRDILISLIKISCGHLNSKIYARNCEVREISNKEARDFNNLNHLQGHRNAQVTYGLFHQNQLVQLMSFSRARYNKNLKDSNSWEIIRGCPGSNNIVIGGVSKLFTHFIRLHNPSSIFSYCDFNKFDGRSYEAIGMKFIGFTGPNKLWLIEGKAVNRNPTKHQELKEKAEACIYGSGSKKYLWTAKSTTQEAKASRNSYR